MVFRNIHVDDQILASSLTETDFKTQVTMLISSEVSLNTIIRDYIINL